MGYLKIFVMHLSMGWNFKFCNFYHYKIPIFIIDEYIVESYPPFQMGIPLLGSVHLFVSGIYKIILL